MSSGKNILVPFQIVTSGSMAGNLTSAVTDITKIDNVGIQLIFTGTPTGEFFVDGSLNYSPANNGAKLANAGDWVAIDLPSSALAAGSASSILLDLNQLSFPNIRVRYVRSSGTGTLNAYISGKGV